MRRGYLSSLQAISLNWALRFKAIASVPGWHGVGIEGLTMSCRVRTGLGTSLITLRLDLLI